MLRFQTNTAATSTSRRNRIHTNKLRWRVWLLIIALGIVIATIRQLNQPTTVQRLGQIFGTDADVPNSDAPQQFKLSMAEVTDSDWNRMAKAEQSTPQAPGTVQDDLEAALAQVEDNTYFRPAEHEAWFHLLGNLQVMTDSEISEASVGELTYAQLLQQPEEYRGKIVTLHGVLRREELEPAPENEVGVSAYHRLVIQPRGGGNWPFVVYCLELPEGFPRGVNLNSTISVDGYFFKNWSYAWQNGLGVAPVILARNVTWEPVPPARSRRVFSGRELTIVALIAGVFAVAVAWLVAHLTRRPAYLAGAPAPIDLPSSVQDDRLIYQKLQQLAEVDTQE